MNNFSTNLHNKLTIGYLTYVNEANKSYRQKHFNDSINTFKYIEKFNCVSVDNCSIECVKQTLQNKPFKKYVHFNENFFDIAVFFVTLWEAKRNNSDYLMYCYDDFIMHQDANEKLIACIKHLDDKNNADVACVRVPIIEFNNFNQYNCDITNKSKNPDAIRFYNTVSNQKLIWEQCNDVNSYKFLKTNWHYTSRPTIWRTDIFEKLCDIMQVPVLQGFEKYASTKFEQMNMLTSIIDGGIMKTTPAIDSARTNEIDHQTELSIKISIEKLYNEYNACQLQL